MKIILRKIILLSCIITILFNLTSCSFGAFEKFVKGYNDEEYVDDFAKAIESSCLNKDISEIKKFFAKSVIDDCSDIDEQIKELHNFIDCCQGQGKLKLRGGPGSTGDVVNGTVMKKNVTAWYSLTEQNDIYLLIFSGLLEDKEEPDNIGIHSLRVIKVKEEDVIKNRLAWTFSWKEVESVKGIQLVTDYKYH